MARLSVLPAALLAAAVACYFSGCNSASPTADKDTGKATEEGHDHSHEGHDHDHDHAHEGPHGGHLIELGDEEYHGEWTHDEEGKVTIYILDGAAKKTVPIAAETVTIEVKIGDTVKSFDLAAVNRTDGEMPQAFQFEIVDKSLLGALEATKGIEASLKVDVNGKPFVGKIEADHGHAH